MKIPMPCMSCFAEQGYPSNEFHLLEFNDNGKYEVRCKKGHKSIVVLQQQKFEILFEIGANAIIDGYYREAVSSFTSSLERFYEFCMKVLCKKRGIDTEVFTDGWKQVANQSERQLGAFLFLWISEFGEVPKLLPNTETSFRNSVIHKGKIPTREEVLRYGNLILLLVREKITELKATCADEVSNITMEHICNTSKINGGQISGGTMHLGTIINLVTNENSEAETLECALQRMNEMRERIRNVDPM